MVELSYRQERPLLHRGGAIDPLVTKKPLEAILNPKNARRIEERVLREAAKKFKKNHVKRSLIELLHLDRKDIQFTLFEVQPNGEKEVLRRGRGGRSGPIILEGFEGKMLALHFLPTFSDNKSIPINVGIEGFEGFQKGTDYAGRDVFVKDGTAKRVAIGKAYTLGN